MMSEEFFVSENSDLSLVVVNSRKSSFVRDLLSRREVARRLLGVTAAWSLGGLHPVWGHLLNEPLLANSDTDLASANWKPLFLRPEQNEALQSFSEATVPGSTNALVSRFIDLLLSVDSPPHQEKFLASLSAIQAVANQQFGIALQKLSALQLNSVLTFVSASPEDSAIRESFEDLKEWVVGSYYSSEMGMKELGWTPNRFFPSFPGCTHPEEHL
jgi:Gluconate 2-dehydrogenase subunit 3